MSEETALTPFEFEGNAVRTLRDESGEPLFAAADVCKVLGITNTGDALSRLDSDEKRDIGSTDVTGRQQKIWFVTESGVYHLIFTSRKTEAERFRKWVTSEVLPAIRKTGQYTAQALTPLQQLEATVAIMREQQAQLSAHDQRLRALESQAQGEVEHFSIIGYCKLRGLPAPSENEARSMGIRAVKLSKAMGQRIGKTTHGYWGTINTYHVSVLDELYKGK
jgi:prophage antirepressor-like protein